MTITQDKQLALEIRNSAKGLKVSELKRSLAWYRERVSKFSDAKNSKSYREAVIHVNVLNSILKGER